MTDHVRYFCERCSHSFPYVPGRFRRSRHCPACGGPLLARFIRERPTLVEPISVRSMVSIFEQIDQAKEALRKKFG